MRILIADQDPDFIDIAKSEMQFAGNGADVLVSGHPLPELRSLLKNGGFWDVIFIGDGVWNGWPGAVTQAICEMSTPPLLVVFMNADKRVTEHMMVLLFKKVSRQTSIAKEHFVRQFKKGLTL